MSQKTCLSLQAGINVLAVDANDGDSPLAGVNLKLLPSGQTGVTSNEGAASIGGIPPGSQVLYLDKEGYAPAIREVDAKAYGATTQNVEIVQLYKLSKTIIGFIDYPDNNGNDVPAQGATIRLTFSDEYGFVEKTIEVTAGNDGKFVFANLPAAEWGYSIEALEFMKTIDGKEVKFPRRTLCQDDDDCLLSGAVPSYSYNLTNGAIESEFRLLNRIIELDDALSPVVLNFSEAIDVERTRKEGGRINVNLPSEITYSEDKKTVTIAPLGKWRYAPSISIVNRTHFFSVKGQYLVANPSIQVTIKPPTPADLSAIAVQGLAITSTAAELSAGLLKLQWNKVAGADEYVVYVKAKGLTTGYEELDEDYFGWFKHATAFQKPC